MQQGVQNRYFMYDSLGRIAAEYSTNLSPTQQVSYITADHLGSPRVITDKTGNVVSRRDFQPFGEELYADGTYRTTANKFSVTGQDNVRKRFTGYEKDQETQLDFAEARYYNNQFGRFTAVDPLLASGKSGDPQSFNRYVYVLNNPILLVDIDGEKPVWWRRREGNQYHYKISDGSPGEGYEEYRGPRTITAERHDWGNRWYLGARGAYAIRDRESDRPLPRGQAKPTRPNPPAINDALLKDLGRRAPGMQKMILLLALSSVAGGAGAAGAVGAPTFFLVVGGEAMLAEQGIRQLGEAERQQALTMMASTQLQTSGTIDPSKVMFSQDSISPNFKDPQYGSVNDLAEGLRNKTIDPNSIDPIRVYEKDGKIISLDNRRLEAFKQAGVPIRYRLATAEEIGLRKITTRNGGTSIRIRGR